MVKASIGNFLIVGIMAALFILLIKSVAGVFNLPSGIQNAVYAI